MVRIENSITGEVWERTGECNRCGECCNTGDPFQGEMGDAPVHGACPLFQWAEPGRGRCSDRQNHYYLNACAPFPSNPDQIADKPGCSYTFRKLSDGNQNLQAR